MDSVTICNLALMMVGIPPITSFDETNNNAKLCREFFPVLRDRVLRDHCWSFATQACELQMLNETCFDPNFHAVCALPGDLIRILGLSDDRPYRRIGNRIFVTQLPARLVYIQRVEDPELFDETFTEALQYLIASEIGMANTRDANLIQLYRREYERRLSIARSIDSQENRFALQNNPPQSHWIMARNTSGECFRPVKTTVGTEGRQPTPEEV